MDPQGPSQPTLNTAYDQPSNPAQSASENAASKSPFASQQRSAPTAERREPNDAIGGGGNDQSEATPTSVAYGVRDNSKDAGDSFGGPVSNTEGEQMRAAGDGDIASAQDKKHGFGEQGDLASGLDRKKDQQAEIKEARGHGGGRDGVDVQGAIGGRSKGFVEGGGDGVNSSSGPTQSSHAHV